MRLSVLVATLAVPAALAAQFPEVGTYKGYAEPVGTENRITLLMVIEAAVDSTVIKVMQDPKQPPIPLKAQQVISGGFSIGFGNLTCPLVVVGEEWEGICASDLGTPQFTLRFARKAEPPTPAAPAG
jgi:hypothetical protein